MRIHHLNCGCMCPVGGRLFDGFSRGLTATLVCHCLAIETEDGIVLIDTGFGEQDVAKPTSRISPFFIGFNNIRFKPELTAANQLRRLGFKREDVRHIILTHLDFDHAGGLEDFPNATVHLMAEEMQAVGHRKGFIAENRYRPSQWDGVTKWQLYQADGERWFGFEAVRELRGLPPEILLVPLVGHTEGHAGIAIDTGNGWLLHAGDAYFYRREVGEERRQCTPGLSFYQTMMEALPDARRRNQEKLRELSVNRDARVRMFCSHDAIEFRDNNRVEETGVKEKSPANGEALFPA